eukprot:1160827-Pelagomonas_calceolata.AAC.3
MHTFLEVGVLEWRRLISAKGVLLELSGMTDGDSSLKHLLLSQLDVCLLCRTASLVHSLCIMCRTASLTLREVFNIRHMSIWTGGDARSSVVS